MDDKVFTITNDFNNLLISLARSIATVCPKSVVGTYIKDIEKSIKNKQNFVKFIELFCVKVLKYKSAIDSGNDDFFINKDYAEDLDNANTYFDYVISLKSIWHELKPENKEIVKQYMRILCELCQQYYNLVVT